MEVFEWVTQHWLDLLQSIGIVGGLLFTAISLRIDAKVRRVANLLTLTEHHRDLWTNIYQRPELSRVLNPAADLAQSPLTEEEELFVLLAVLHLGSAHRAMRQGMFAPPAGLRMDIQRFFSRPIPKIVWERIKALQDDDFVKFVETSLEDDKGTI